MTLDFEEVLRSSNGHHPSGRSSLIHQQIVSDEDFDMSEHLNMDMFGNDDEVKVEMQTPVSSSSSPIPIHKDTSMRYEFGREKLFDKVEKSIGKDHFDPTLFINENTDNKTKYTLQIGEIPSKSRVETQIKVLLNFYPPPEEHVVHLPAETISKPKLQLKEQFQPNNKTLMIDTVIVCDGEPSRHANMCGGCIKRERKRAFRKKVRLPVEEAHWSEENPKRVIVFNCKEIVEFGNYVDITVDGETVQARQLELPMRLACYCRHHNERTGFRAYFVAKDSNGIVVARGSTTPVMITDDHKAIAPRDDETLSRKRKNSDSIQRPLQYQPPPSQVCPPSVKMMGYDDFSVHRSKTSISSSGGVLSPASTFSGSSTAATSPQSMSAYEKPLMLDHFTFKASSSTNNTSNTNENTNDIPTINRIIPSTGSIRGGYEVTLLGYGFCTGMIAKFGDIKSPATNCWNSSTMIVTVPTASIPGPVIVSIDGVNMGNEAQVFTYVDDTDRELCELALRIVGMKINGKLQEARDVARNIIGQGTNVGEDQLPKSNGGYDSGQYSGWMMKLLDFLDLEELGQYLPDYDMPNDQGQTLLHLAAILGMEEFCEALMDRGASVDIQDSCGMTPLHFACLMKNWSLIDVLIQDPKELYCERYDGKTPVDFITEPYRSIIIDRYDDEEVDDEHDDEQDESNEEALVRAASRQHPQPMMTRINEYITDLRQEMWNPFQRRRQPTIEEMPPSYEEIFPDGSSSAVDYSNAVIEDSTSPRPKQPQQETVLVKEDEVEDEQKVMEAWQNKRKDLNRDRMLFFVWLPLFIFALVWMSMKAVTYMNDVNAEGLRDRILAVGKSVAGITATARRQVTT